MLQTSEKENTTYWNFGDVKKIVLKGKIIAINAYIIKQERSQINNPTSQLTKLEKDEQTKPKVNRKKEIIKIREEINEINNSKT